MCQLNDNSELYAKLTLLHFFLDHSLQELQKDGSYVLKLQEEMANGGIMLCRNTVEYLQNLQDI